jgi:hypothetical protein
LAELLVFVRPLGREGEDSTLVRDVGQGQRRGRRLLGGRRNRRRWRFGRWRGVVGEEATGVKEREVDLGCGRLGWAEGVGLALEVGEEAPHGGAREGEEGFRGSGFPVGPSGSRRVTARRRRLCPAADGDELDPSCAKLNRGPRE